jgi:hypothetical protein
MVGVSWSWMTAGTLWAHCRHNWGIGGYFEGKGTQGRIVHKACRTGQGRRHRPLVRPSTLHLPPIVGQKWNRGSLLKKV